MYSWPSDSEKNINLVASKYINTNRGPILIKHFSFSSTVLHQSRLKGPAQNKKELSLSYVEQR